MHISNPFWANDLEETGIHRENNGPHAPTIDEAIITLGLYTIQDNVGRKVVGGPAHCLSSVDQEKKTEIVRVSSHPAVQGKAP